MMSCSGSGAPTAVGAVSPDEDREHGEQMNIATRIMVAGVAATALMGTSVAVAEAGPSAAAAPAKWHCAGKKVLRCIQRSSANKVQLNFTNKTYKTVKSEFGVTCQGTSGQKVYSLKKNLKPRGGYLSKVITCPPGLRDTAVGWQMTPSGNVEYTPNIKI
jgi:hypothetical protein